ncbi:hypothetical protein HHK36_013492 [Tetracentron sinense]|uniref:Uncharacterized protein n=1 Tax=Tetracentron sinense TaxID=13715 RepID=A0A834Z7A0_TETSI|nr:hypothetical protein HHK36_013492 [Tetracentron sinense]
MTLFGYPCFPSNYSVSSSPSSSLLCSFKPISSTIRRKPISAIIHARDRIIDFGKYRGKMLGTLPSNYLKWVSKNLRARDFEDWAKLADEVLQDPVYRDRLEWEFAEKLLNGDGPSMSSRTESPVSDLLEISKRFGWDNENKVAWSRIDFALLGTSKGGRIPRNQVSEDRNEEKKMGYLKQDLRLKSEKKQGFPRTDSRVPKTVEMDGDLERNSNSRREKRLVSLGNELRDSSTDKMGSQKERKVGFLNKGYRISVAAEEEEDLELESSGREKREERRERQRLKRGLQMHKLRLNIREKRNDDEIRVLQNENHDQDQTADNYNPFPGREALLKKVLNRRSVL